MDKSFISEADTFFTERHNHVLVEFRKSNEGVLSMLNKIKCETDIINGVVSDMAWQHFKYLFELLELQGDIESKKLYIQGFKDCIVLGYFLDTGFINSECPELLLNRINTENR